VVGEVLLGVVQQVGGVKQGLGGDAAHVQAGATQGATRLNAGNLYTMISVRPSGKGERTRRFVHWRATLEILPSGQAEQP